MIITAKDCTVVCYNGRSEDGDNCRNSSLLVCSAYLTAPRVVFELGQVVFSFRCFVPASVSWPTVNRESL